MDTHENELNPSPPVTVPGRQDTELPTPVFEEVNTPETDAFKEVDVSGAQADLTQSLQISQSQEKTRAQIALFFTQVFLTLVTIAFVLPTVLYMIAPNTLTNPVEFTKDLVTTIASILAGPFGFIVGFYFKKDSN